MFEYEELLQAILIDLIILLISLLFSKTFRIYKHILRSEFTGLWEACIYNEAGTDVIKKDEMRILHNAKSKTFRGKVKRNMPDSFRNRSWGVQGVLTNETLVCTYWTEQRVGSICSAAFRRVEDFHYIGQYIKNDPTTASIKSAKIEIILIKELTFREKIKLLFFKSHVHSKTTPYGRKDA